MSNDSKEPAKYDIGRQIDQCHGRVLELIALKEYLRGAGLALASSMQSYIAEREGHLHIVWFEIRKEIMRGLKHFDMPDVVTLMKCIDQGNAKGAEEQWQKIEELLKNVEKELGVRVQF